MFCEFFNTVILCCFSSCVISVCESFKSMFFILCSSIAFLNVFSIGFQKQLFGGFISLTQDPQFWVHKGSGGKEFACYVVDMSSIPGLGRFHEEEKSYPLQYSSLENSMNCIVHGVTKGRSWLSDFHFHFAFNVELKFPPPERRSVCNFVILLDCETTMRFYFWVRKVCWRRDKLPAPIFLGFPCYSAGKESACNVGDVGWIPGLVRSPGEGNGLPTPIFWPGKFHGWYGFAESDTTEWLSLSLFTAGV